MSVKDHPSPTRELCRVSLSFPAPLLRARAAVCGQLSVEEREQAQRPVLERGVPAWAQPSWRVCFDAPEFLPWAMARHREQSRAPV